MYKELKSYNTSTEMGYVYILYNPESELVKIGKTKSPQKRFSALSHQSGSKLKYYITEPMYIETLIERIMHNKYNKYRVKGEWFKGVEFDGVKNELIELCNCEDFKRRNKIKEAN
jgi:hypothetical protein